MGIDSSAWTSRADVKAWLGITDTSKDDLIDRLVNAAYKLLESYIHHPLLAADYTEYYDGDNTNSLVLRNYPIISITSIHDDTGRDFASDSLIDSTYYIYENNSNDRMGEVRLWQGVDYFAKGVQNVKIVYRAGYATIPADAAQACIMLVDWLMNRAGTMGKTAESLGGKSESYERELLPLHIRQMVQPYKNFSV